MNAIAVAGLAKRFGDVRAVADASFEVGKGELFGFLGPNGAGKTTTVRILTGYLLPSAGRVLVEGHDLAQEPTLARQHIGVVPEEANVYVDLTVWQNVMLMAELHGLSRAQRTQRAKELLELFGLADRIHQKGRALSKGLRQRLMICMGLVSAPEILFLDEPTSGLDVASARLIRELVVRMNRERNMTVFLTTHNIEEADQLCHRVAIINKGKIAAMDTPRALRSLIASRRSVEVAFAGQTPDLSELLEWRSETETVPITNGWRIYCREPGRIAQDVSAKAAQQGYRIENIRTLEPSLEDVFLYIVQSYAAAPSEPRP